MPSQNKPKVTIGPDGTIHVDIGDHSQNNASSKNSNSNTAPPNAPKKSSKTTEADSNKKQSSRTEQHASTSGDVEFRNTSPQPTQPSKKRKSVPDSVMLLLAGVGMIFLGVVALPDIRLIVVGVLSIAVAFYCNEWH